MKTVLAVKVLFPTFETRIRLEKGGSGIDKELVRNEYEISNRKTNCSLPVVCCGEPLGGRAER